ncbi:sensor histidine kinase [Arsenicicoccus sp. oral taxon 190]|uniref:sensor histidine kinase n=1 Tax=Arsenicicoccus sp. oral taxon 190 TaxID=1658671 RepID=UPI00067A0AC7|nr:histidine kinase [Arsenicicoccus sp. oral taxon 190]AKT51353.1 hypothetical protein ADJ73_08510 [Arsenicicoccus sp. oral taxon 190]
MRPLTAAVPGRVGLPRWLVLGLGLLVLASVLDDAVLQWESAAPLLDRLTGIASQLGAATCLVLLVLRPRWAYLALAVTLATSLLAGMPLPGVAALGLCLGAAGLRRCRPTLAALAGVSAVYAGAVTLRNPPAAAVLWLVAPALTVVVLGTWVVGTALAQRRQAEERAAELEHAAVAAREQERRLLARELHDVVAHGLTLVAMQASVIRTTQDPQVQEGARATIETTARSALHELQHLLGVLRTSDAIAATADAATTVPETVEQLVADCGRLGYDLTARVDAGELPCSVILAIDRLLREAVTNVVKHSGPAPCSLTIRRVGSTVAIEVRNRLGAPRQPGPSHGHGLPGLAERVRLLGGTFSAGVRDGQWVLLAYLPV